jgi:hypothetical protein
MWKNITMQSMSLPYKRTELGPKFSEGARLLWLAMRENKWSQGELGKAIDAKPGVVNRWLYGDIRPGLAWAEELLAVVKIPLSAWNQRPVRAFVPPAARAA